MSINNPLIKTRDTGRIISKTAEIYELLKRDQKEERPKMKNTKDLLKAYTDATIYGGVENNLGDMLGTKTAKALTQALDKSARTTYMATQNLFGRTAAVAGITTKGPTPPKASDDTTPSSAPKLGGR